MPSSAASSMALSISSSLRRSPEMARCSSGAASSSMLLRPAWKQQVNYNSLITLLDTVRDEETCHLYLCGVLVLLIRPVSVIFLLSLHELPEMILDEERGVKLSHCDLIIYNEMRLMILIIRDDIANNCVCLISDLRLVEWPDPAVSYWCVSRSS